MIFNYDVSDLQNTIQGQISAYIQTSTTASRAYSVGDYFILNGVLYRVISAISNGGTITIGTNASAASIGTEITKARSKIYGTTLAANSTFTINKINGDHLYLVFAQRASQSTSACVWICDQWGGIITLHSGSIATLTNTTNTFELKNNLNAYIDIGVIRFSDMAN